MNAEDRPAFPLAVPEQFTFIETGLTRRELFAAMAMQGILASLSNEEPLLAIPTAVEAVECADALIARLDG